MIRKEIEIVGKTDSDGKFMIYGLDEVNDFFKKHPNHRIIGEFRVFDTRKSEAMVGLYFQYYVPEFQAAYYKLGERYLKEQVDEKLRLMSTVTKKELRENGKWTYELREVEDLNNCELVEFLDELQGIAAMDFNIVIYDNRV